LEIGGSVANMVVTADRGIGRREGVMASWMAYIERDEETGLYVGIVPGLPGAHTQAETLEELRANLEEVVALCLEEQPELREQRGRFVGVQEIEVA
jgi:predicted RNase H-like HicB family nuclease